MRNSTRRAAVGAALLSVAFALTMTDAAAEPDLAVTITPGVPDTFSCELSTVTCWVSAIVNTDWNTPVTISVDGAVLGTAPTRGCCDTQSLAWIPKTGGRHVITVQQGTKTASRTVNLIDYNSPQGLLKRYLWPLS